MKIKIEKLGYKLTDLEKNVMNTISYDNISSVDKLCLYNLGKQYPNTLKHDIANDIYCNICASSIDNINISYLSCGHIFCSSCVLRIININIIYQIFIQVQQMYKELDYVLQMIIVVL